MLRHLTGFFRGDLLFTGDVSSLTPFLAGLELKVTEDQSRREITSTSNAEFIRWKNIFRINDHVETESMQQGTEAGE